MDSNLILRCSLKSLQVCFLRTGLSFLPGDKITPTWSVFIKAWYGNGVWNNSGLFVRQLSSTALPLVGKSTYSTSPDKVVSEYKSIWFKSPPQRITASGKQSRNSSVSSIIQSIRSHSPYLNLVDGRYRPQAYDVLRAVTVSRLSPQTLHSFQQRVNTIFSDLA